MNILIDPAPKTVTIGGAEVPINSDFRASVRFEMMMEDSSLSELDKTVKALSLYYDTGDLKNSFKPPAPIEEAIDKMLWFYRAGKEENCAVSAGKGAQIYSYSYDDEYIFAAFLEQYGVDLQDIPYLHWWKFKAMFLGLKSDSRIVEIMGYRSIDITSKMSNEQKQFYRKMKKQFAIPLPQPEREKLNAIEQALLNGGDVSKVL